MTCQDLATHLYAYLDDELSVVETLRVQGHLAFCHGCRGIAESEASLRGLIEADALEERAPAALRERILGQIAEQPLPQPSPGLRPGGPRVRPFLAGLLGGAVAMAALLGFFTHVWRPVSRDLSPLAAEVAAKHQIYSRDIGGLQVATTDPSEVAAWLGERLRFPVKLPLLARPGERLVGGRLSSVADGQAAYLLYERDGRRVSLFAFKGQPTLMVPERPVAVEGTKFYASSIHGNTVVWWEDRELYYAAVSDGSLDDLIEFGLLCVRGRASPASAGERPPGQRAMRPGGATPPFRSPGSAVAEKGRGPRWDLALPEGVAL